MRKGPGISPALFISQPNPLKAFGAVPSVFTGQVSSEEKDRMVDGEMRGKGEVRQHIAPHTKKTLNTLLSVMTQ